MDSSKDLPEIKNKRTDELKKSGLEKPPSLSSSAKLKRNQRSLSFDSLVPPIGAEIRRSPRNPLTYSEIGISPRDPELVFPNSNKDKLCFRTEYFTDSEYSKSKTISEEETLGQANDSGSSGESDESARDKSKKSAANRATSSTTTSCTSIPRKQKATFTRKKKKESGKIIRNPKYGKTELIQKAIGRHSIMDHVLTRLDIEAVIYHAGLKNNIYFADSGEGCDLVLMSDHIEVNNNLAEEGKLYLKPNGSYISRYEGKIYSGSLLVGKFGVQKFDMSGFPGNLSNTNFIRSVLNITSKRGHSPGGIDNVISKIEDNESKTRNDRDISFYVILHEADKNNWALIKISFDSRSTRIKYADSACNETIPAELRQKLDAAFYRVDSNDSDFEIRPEFSMDNEIFVKRAPQHDHPVRALGYAIKDLYLSRDDHHPISCCNPSNIGPLRRAVQQCILESCWLDSNDPEPKMTENLDIFEPATSNGQSYRLTDHFINRAVNSQIVAEPSPFDKFIFDSIENLKNDIEKYENSFWYCLYRWWNRGKYEEYLAESKRLIPALALCRNCDDLEYVQEGEGSLKKSIIGYVDDLHANLTASKVLADISRVLKKMGKKINKFTSKSEHIKKFRKPAQFLKTYTDKLKNCEPGDKVAATTNSWIGKEYSIRQYKDDQPTREANPDTLPMELENHYSRDKVLGSFYRIVDDKNKNDTTKLVELEIAASKHQKQLKGTPLGDTLANIRANKNDPVNANNSNRPAYPDNWRKYDEVWNANGVISDATRMLNFLRDFIIEPYGIFSGRSHINPVKKVLKQFENAANNIQVQHIQDALANELDRQQVKENCELMKRIRYSEYKTATTCRLALKDDLTNRISIS